MEGHVNSEQWRHAMEANFEGLQVQALEGAPIPVRGAILATDLAGVGVFDLSGNPQRVVRTVQGARRSPTELLKVCAVRRGECVIEQSGREIHVRPGQLGLYDTARAYRITWKGDWSCGVMTISPELLAVPERVLNGAQVHPWDTSTGVGAMLMQFLSSSAVMSPSSEAAQIQLATAGAALLAGTILGDQESAVERAPGQLRQRVESYVDQHLLLPDLTLAGTAAALGVSIRTVQRAFTGSGEGVSALIRRRRLEEVRHDLSDAQFDHLSIAEIAARWCLHDAQWLARAFRAQFSISPSEFRRSRRGSAPVGVHRARG